MLIGMSMPKPPKTIHLWWCPGCGHRSINKFFSPVHFGVMCNLEPILLEARIATDTGGKDPVQDFADKASNRILEDASISGEAKRLGLERAARIIRSMVHDLDVLGHMPSEGSCDDPYESARYLFLGHEYRPQDGGYRCGCGWEGDSAATHLADVVRDAKMLSEE